MITPLPQDFRVVLDPGVTHLDDHTLFGGSPARAMRLTTSGRVAWSELKKGPIRSRAAARLARQLTDAGLAHPRPPLGVEELDVTVVIPVRDRCDLLEQCLAALGSSHPVVVVDDGSEDPGAVAAVAAAHGAHLVRRPVNGGPGAARNSGLVGGTSEFVALLDSDCVPPPDWITRLGAHFADPSVGAVAPRIVDLAPGIVDTDRSRRSDWVARFTAAAGTLDLGTHEARVEPRTRVAYVPTAALLVRRTALREVAVGDDVFDPALRFGEDVDLVWRLHAAGWRIRYEPSVEVAHREPRTWRDLLMRRFRYGTSAAPLAERHPDSMHPLVLHLWPALAVAGLLSRQPGVAAVGFGAAVMTTRRTLRSADVPTAGVVRSMLSATGETGIGLGRYCSQFAAPVLAGALCGRNTGRRRAAAALWLGPPLVRWVRTRPPLDPVRFVIGQLADDTAYGAGVWAGCLRARTARPLYPHIAWKALWKKRSPRSPARRRPGGNSSTRGSL